MEETASPKYSSESFLPLPTEVNKQRNFTPRKHNNFNEKNPNTRHDAGKEASDSLLVPWKRSDPYSCGVIGLHEEIKDFYETMSPTDEEREIRLRVVEHITKTIHSMWPYAEVQVFGSFRTGLYLPSSDIDMVVIGEWKNLPLQTLSEALQRNGVSEMDITVIAKATVPIVRLKHTPSQVKVDISFNLRNGIEGALLVKKLMRQYPPLPKLVLVLKQFLVQRGLNEVYNGGMSSYCLTLLIVSLLQGNHKPATFPSLNLGTILLEFFEHYGINFNYERVSIHFQHGGNYQPKFRSDGLLCVEDPLVKGNDLAKGTYLMHALRFAFENAFNVLHKAVTDSEARKTPLDSYLSLIISVEEKLINERRWLAQNHGSILSKLTELTPHSSEAHQDDVPSFSGKGNVKKKKHRF